MDVQLIFKDATKIQNGHQKSTPKFFVGAKFLKLNVKKLLKIYDHIPQNHDTPFSALLYHVILCNLYIY